MTETVTVLRREPTCADRVAEEWKERQEDLKDPEYEALSFDYVEPNTFNDQIEGYWVCANVIRCAAEKILGSAIGNIATM